MFMNTSTGFLRPTQQNPVFMPGENEAIPTGNLVQHLLNNENTIVTTGTSVTSASASTV